MLVLHELGQFEHGGHAGVQAIEHAGPLVPRTREEAFGEDLFERGPLGRVELVRQRFVLVQLQALMVIPHQQTIYQHWRVVSCVSCYGSS